jgi:glucosamine--fructose-6-phosphate aminotransferase (isomerizing)
MIAGMLHIEGNITGSAYLKELKSLPEIGKRIIGNLRERVKGVPFKRYKQFVFLGSGPFYGIACESMLKMKEMAIVPSDSYHSLEFRHGPKSILGEDVLVSIFLSDTARECEEVLISEIKQLGGSVLVVCEKADSSLAESSDYLIEIESNLGDFSRSVILLPVAQLLAFYKAVSKNIDVDSPRNLTYYVSL